MCKAQDKLCIHTPVEESSTTQENYVKMCLLGQSVFVRLYKQAQSCFSSVSSRQCSVSTYHLKSANPHI